MTLLEELRQQPHDPDKLREFFQNIQVNLKAAVQLVSLMMQAEDKEEFLLYCEGFDALRIQTKR